jgi:hypothetical protein
LTPFFSQLAVPPPRHMNARGQQTHGTGENQ